MKLPKEMIASVTNQAMWPASLREVINSAVSSIDNDFDLSTEQAIGLGIFLGQSNEPTQDVGRKPTGIELATWSHHDAMTLATQQEWSDADKVRIRGILSAIQGVMATVLSPDRVTEGEGELKKLVDFLTFEGFSPLDEDEFSKSTPAEIAINAMKQLSVLRAEAKSQG